MMKDSKMNGEEVAPKINSSNDSNNNLQECLLGMDNEDILNNPVFRIADLAVSMHMPSNCQGFMNLRKIERMAI
jgi:hypothetical protein